MGKKKIQDPARIKSKDTSIPSQTLLPLGYWDLMATEFNIQVILRVSSPPLSMPSYRTQKGLRWLVLHSHEHLTYTLGMYTSSLVTEGIQHTQPTGSDTTLKDFDS